MPIHALLLDLDGTINTSKGYYSAFEERYLEYVSAKLGKTRAEARMAVKEAKRTWHSLTLSLESMGITRREFYEEMASKLPVDLLVDRDDQLRAVLSNIREQGVRVGLLTNSGRPLVTKVLEALGCPERCFDLVLTSFETGLKPSREPFLQAVSLLGIRPSQIAYAGDRIRVELRTAKEVGMCTICISMSKPRVHSRWVDWYLGSVYEIPDLLLNLRAREGAVH